MMDSVSVKTHDVWFSYDGKSFIVQGLNLSIMRGKVTMMLGRSGSGKTTILKILAGLLNPQKGHLTYADDTNGTKSKRYAAYIPQTLGLVRNRSALENCLCGTLSFTSTFRSAFGRFPKKFVDRAKATLTELGLQNSWDKPVMHLSGGQRQRVAIARALMQDSPLILADEFVSQLDPVTADEILEMIKKFTKQQGKSFLITTHELDVVEHYADEFFIVRDGSIAHGGAADQFSPIDARRILKNETLHF